ncbi:uncharacterized protein LOC143041728 [Oratosquilla oratoria]|uniref:uncharacterized protein LOC143041728 n=1 Tax=Oratosquilla oratoria TaxID=337810 RepID=UPI003F75EC22
MTKTAPGIGRPETRIENDRRVETANTGSSRVPETSREYSVPVGEARVIPTPKNWKNFEKLSGQIHVFLEENPATVETAAEIVTVFAMRQQFYARTYSQLCTFLMKKLSKESADAYRTRLGVQCKRLFEVSENLSCTGRNPNAEMELNSIKVRKQYVALCSYIANLCLEGIFECRRVALCIKSLLKKGDEASLEAVCALLETAGHKLDQSVKVSPVGTQVVNSIYSLIKEMVEKKLTSNRMRYLLLDIVELRERGWKPRIHKDVPQ